MKKINEHQRDFLSFKEWYTYGVGVGVGWWVRQKWDVIARSGVEDSSVLDVQYLVFYWRKLDLRHDQVSCWIIRYIIDKKSSYWWLRVNKTISNYFNRLWFAWDVSASCACRWLKQNITVELLPTYIYFRLCDVWILKQNKPTEKRLLNCR